MKTKLITRHRELSAKIAALQNELAQIERSTEYLNELKWENDLKALMATHGKTANDVLNILVAPTEPKQRSRGPKAGTPRVPITYKNPYTGEQIRVASGNSRVLKEWKKDYPNDDIKNWII